MSNRNYRRRPRRRVTGRFFAFLSILAVLIVLACVLIFGRGGAPSQGAAAPAAPAATATPAPAQQAENSPAATGEGYEAEEPVAPVPAEDIVEVTDLSVTQGLPSQWRNILLLGTDTRNMNKVERTDTIMIASVNSENGQVKLTSIMRDLVVPYANDNGETRQVKINSLIGRGGPDVVMKTVNQLFQMNITEYVMVNFASFQSVVDILGGVDMDITQEEMEEINQSLGEMAKAAGYDQQWYLANKDSLTLKTYGQKTHLTGIQALGYVRIRHVGNADYTRTERQRNLLDAVLRKVKQDAGVVQLMQLATSMWGEVSTNMNFSGALSLATTVIQSGTLKLDASKRLPDMGTFVSESRSSLGNALYDCDFSANAQSLYNTIYQS